LQPSPEGRPPPARSLFRCPESHDGKLASGSSGKRRLHAGQADGRFPNLIDLLTCYCRRGGLGLRSPFRISPSPLKAAACSSFQTVSLAQPIKTGSSSVQPTLCPHGQSCAAEIAEKERLCECKWCFCRSADWAVHAPVALLDAKAETPTRRGWITTDVPILRIDHLSTQGTLLGVWRVSLAAVSGMRWWENWRPALEELRAILSP
jgi:hypothetical protein